MSRKLLSPLVRLGLAAVATCGPAVAAAAAAGDAIPVSGLVRSADGTPLAGAAVRLHPVLDSRRSGLLVLSGEVATEPAVVTVTDAAGAYRLEAPAAGMWRLVVEAAGRVPMRHDLQPLLGPRRLPTVRLEPDAGATVTVLGADGASVAGARVWGGAIAPEAVWGERHGWSPTGRFAVTDAAGRTRLPRAAGEALRVGAWADGLLESQADLTADGVVLHLSRGLPRRTVALAADGRSLAGAVVRVGPSRVPAAVTDEAGQATLPLDPAGPTLIEVDTQDQGRLSGALAPPVGAVEAAAELQLPPPTFVAGRVVDRDSGEPIVGALVWPRDDTGGWRRSDHDGAFRLPREGDGACCFAAAAAGYQVAYVRLEAGPAEGLSFRLAPAVSITGVVVDEAGEPLGDAEVAARRYRRYGDPWEEARGARSTWSTTDGRFSLGGLPADGGLELRATAPGLAPTELGPVSRDEELRIVLHPGGALAGQVVDEGDAQLAGVTVRLFEVEGDDTLRFVDGAPAGDLEVVTDKEGRFRAEHLGSGRWNLLLLTPGRAPVDLRGIEVPGGGRTLDLGRLVVEPEAVVEGRVTDPDGQPLEGVRVTIGVERWASGHGYSFTGEPPAGVASGRDGRFRLGGLRRGERISLQLRHPEYVDRRVEGVEAPASEPLEIVLRPGSRVTGRVLDPAGRGVAEAHVAVHVDRRGTAFGGDGPRFLDSGKTDSEGRFGFAGLPRGELRLEVDANGFPSYSGHGWELREGGEVGPIAVQLEGGAAVEGVVWTADGRPAAEVFVHLSSAERNAEGRTESYQQAARTDDAGRFRIAPWPPGPANVWVRDPVEGTVERQLEVGPGLRPMELMLASVGGISGRVVDQEGRPVPEARVDVEAVEGSSSWTFFADEVGRFRLAPGPGDYHLRASSPTAATAAYPEVVHLGNEPVEELVLRLAEGAEVVGWIAGVEERLAGQVEVAAWRELAEGVPGEQRDGTVDYQGRYRIAGLSPGAWRVQARLASRGLEAHGKVTLAAGERQAVLDLRFADGLTLSGRLSLNGAPLSAAVVSFASGETSGSIATDAAGRFRIDGLPPGSYELTVRSRASRSTFTETVEVLSDGQEVTFDWVAGEVQGAVRSAATGEPVVGATVALVDDQVGAVWRSADATTDAAGGFRIGWVAAGGYRLTVRAEGYQLAAFPIEITDPSPRQIEVLLHAAAAPLVLLPRLWSGAVPPRLTLVPLDDAGEPLFGQEASTEGGEARLEGLPPGRRRILVHAEGAAPTSIEVEVPAPPLPVVLPPPCRLELRVPGLAGEAAASLVLRNAADGFPWPEPLVLRHGEGRIDVLPPGSWTVEVTAPDGRQWRGVAVTAPGAPAELVLE